VGWFQRGRALPDELVSAIATQGQLLDWSEYSDGLIAVTKRSLVQISGEEVKVTPWSDSLQAKWDPPRLTVTFQGQSDLEPRPVSFVLDEASQLPRAVRDRVTSAVVVDRVYELPNAGRVRFVARKDDLRTYWSVLADDPVTSQTDIGQTEIAQALAELRSTFGI
jgi:hypothetical protein